MLNAIIQKARCYYQQLRPHIGHTFVFSFHSIVVSYTLVLKLACSGPVRTVALIFKETLTFSLTILGAVRPRDATLEAQLAAHHIGQLDVHLVIANSSPRVVVQHLHSSLVHFSWTVPHQAHFGGGSSR